MKPAGTGDLKDLPILRGFGQVYALIFCLAVFPVVVRADPLSQGFEPPEWPVISSWTTYTDGDGWKVNDAQVLQARGGYGTPIDTQCLWLHDYDSSTNSWVRSPLLALGVKRVSYYCRRPHLAVGSNVFALQVSTDTVNWVSHAIVTNATDSWVEHTSIDFRHTTAFTGAVDTSLQRFVRCFYSFPVIIMRTGPRSPEGRSV